MVLQKISLLTAFLGSSLAAIWDLKTTEVPDEIPYAMIAIALILHAIQSFLTQSYFPLLNSIIAGLGLGAFGFLMYRLGQWGGADALLLSSIGFLLPNLPSGFNVSLLFPFPVSYLFNVFLIGAIYMLLYAFVFALLNKRIFSEFSRDLKASSKILFFGCIALFLLFFGINFYLVKYFEILSLQLILINSTLPLILTVFLFLIWRFAKVVENVGFKKKISISKLKVGDVLQESKLWVGITEKELKKIRKSGKKFVMIKEGVRFAPTFPLALFFTFYFGDGILFFIRFIQQL